MQNVILVVHFSTIMLWFSNSICWLCIIIAVDWIWDIICILFESCDF